MYRRKQAKTFLYEKKWAFIGKAILWNDHNKSVIFACAVTCEEHFVCEM